MMTMPVVRMNIYPWCNCFSTGRFLPQDGYTLDPPSGLWVHGRCRKPSKMNYDRNVLGLEQIPQPKKEEDYYEMERAREARTIIIEELGWEQEDDDDEYY